MRVEQAVNIEDLRCLAKRRLPRAVYDFIEGGVEDERCLLRNESSFGRHQLVPRYLVDVSKRDQSRTLFDRLCEPFRHFADRVRRIISRWR
jgi:L-lactate dehydrogenase (cytochrome)/(S)-mandelate dehydrogenase